MIEVTAIRIQTLNGDIMTRQETVTNCHTFSDKAEMEAWRTAKEMKLQYRANCRHAEAGGDPDHVPRVYVALTYCEK